MNFKQVLFRRVTTIIIKLTIDQQRRFLDTHNDRESVIMSIYGANDVQ